MTASGIVELTCCVCGAKAVETVVQSLRASGPRDLDGRPPDSARGAIRDLLHRCEACGYVAPRLAPTPGLDPAALDSAAYRRLRDDAGAGWYVRAFRCRAFILAAAGERAAAGLELLQAAWECDDAAGHPTAGAEARARAAGLRQEAIGLIEPAAREGLALGAVSWDLVLPLIDMLRRTAQWDRAAALCAQATARATRAREHGGVLLRQAALIAGRDTAAHRRDGQSSAADGFGRLR